MDWKEKKKREKQIGKVPGPTKVRENRENEVKKNEKSECWLYASCLRIFVGSKSLNKNIKNEKKKKRQNEKQMMGRFKLFGLGNEKF